jgi:hypothetical protein
MNLIVIMIITTVGAISIVYCSKKPNFSSTKRFAIGFFSQFIVALVLGIFAALYQISHGDTFEYSNMLIGLGLISMAGFITGVKCANAGD